MSSSNLDPSFVANRKKGPKKIKQRRYNSVYLAYRIVNDRQLYHRTRRCCCTDGAIFCRLGCFPRRFSLLSGVVPKLIARLHDFSRSLLCREYCGKKQRVRDT